MARFAPLLRSASGLRHYMRREDDGRITVASFQDVDAILDRNRAMESANDGYSADRTMRRVASIPLALVLKWREEEGWDALDPACADALKAKLNSNEFLYLRTAPGRL